MSLHMAPQLDCLFSFYERDWSFFHHLFLISDFFGTHHHLIECLKISFQKAAALLPLDRVTSTLLQTQQPSAQ